MRLYCLAGNRTAALHQFEICTAILREDLDVEPTASTVALYQQISNEQLRPFDERANLSDSLPTLGDTQTLNTLQQLEQIERSPTSYRRRSHPSLKISDRLWAN